MRRHGVFSAVVVFGLLALSACGSGNSGINPRSGNNSSGSGQPPSVAVLLREMGAAMLAAQSFHVSGAFKQDGKLLDMDLSLISSGQLSGQISENGGPLTILVTHGHAYVKLSSAFLKAAKLPSSICSLFCGKYLETTGAESRQLLTGLSMRKLVHGMTSSEPHGLRYAGVVTVDGVQAWLLKDPHGDEVYIAAHGKPYPLRVVSASGGQSLDLTQWDTAQVPAPPPASQVVNLGQLAG